MTQSPPPNVKIYDRPERSGPSPLLLVIVLLVVLIVGYFIFRMMNRPATPQPRTSSISRVAFVSGHKGENYGAAAHTVDNR
jgi:hypothetical protein